MTQNEAYQSIVDCVMATMPDGVRLVRLKAYVSAQNDYMSAAASYNDGDGKLVQAPVSDVMPDLFALLVDMRGTVQGDDEHPWLTTDITFTPDTGSFLAGYGYEWPADGTVTIDA